MTDNRKAAPDVGASRAAGGKKRLKSAELPPLLYPKWRKKANEN